MSINQRLEDLNITIPDAPAPAANYVPYVISGNHVFVSGQISAENGQMLKGKLGADVTLEEGQYAAKVCAINLIAQVKAACGGDLNKVKRVVRLGGFVNSTPNFEDQPAVVNGASDLMVAVFGDAGKHSRAAVSAASLPFGVSVEIDGVFEIET